MNNLGVDLTAINNVIDVMKKYDNSLKLAEPVEKKLEFFRRLQKEMKQHRLDYQKILKYIHVKHIYIKLKINVQLISIMHNLDMYEFLYDTSDDKKSYRLERYKCDIKHKIHVMEVFYAKEIKHILKLYEKLLYISKSI